MNQSERRCAHRRSIVAKERCNGEKFDTSDGDSIWEFVPVDNRTFSLFDSRNSFCERNSARLVFYNNVEKIFDGMEDDITAYYKVNKKLLSTCVALLVTYNVGTVK